MRIRRFPVRFYADPGARVSAVGRRICRPGLLLLPKFELDAARSCADELKKLGFAPLFDADNPLGGLFDRGVPARLDAVLQRTVLKVDERGLEAAAATAVFAVGSTRPEPEAPFEMIVDRPFSCLVFDRTEDYKPCILYAGVGSWKSGPRCPWTPAILWSNLRHPAARAS